MDFLFFVTHREDYILKYALIFAMRFNKKNLFKSELCTCLSMSKSGWTPMKQCLKNNIPSNYHKHVDCFQDYYPRDLTRLNFSDKISVESIFLSCIGN